MAKEDKTTAKRPAKPFTGTEGVTFSKENQPPPEAKKEGWEKLRAKKLLTQKILEKMTGLPLDEYVDSLILNAKLGNAKAIDTINKGIEDQIEQSQVDHKGLEPIIIEWKK